MEEKTEQDINQQKLNADNMTSKQPEEGSKVPHAQAAYRKIAASRKKKAEYKDISDMSEEEIQAPIIKFKTHYLPIIIAVLGCIAAVAYMMWVFGVFGH